jgi:hypothetical protein
MADGASDTLRRSQRDLKAMRLWRNTAFIALLGWPILAMLLILMW